MKKILVSIVCSMPLWVAGQSLSVQQLFEKLDQNLSYQQDVLKTQIRQAELNELRTNRIPVFYVDANLQRNLIIPTTPVPAVAFDPDALDGAIIPLKFATRWSSKAGLQLEWKLFDPSRRWDEKEQALNIRRAEIQTAQNAQDRKRNATLAYTSVVLATQQYELARLDSAAYARIMEVSAARHRAGREPSIAYHTAQQEFERKRIQLHEAWAVLLDADLELRKYIDLAGTATLTTSIESIRDYVATDQKENYTVRSLEIDQQTALIQRQGLKRQLLPVLTLNAYWGEQYFDNDFRLAHGQAWFGNSFVNLALRVPLSGYFTVRPTLRKTALQYTLVGKQLTEEQRLDDIHNRQQTVKIQSARQKLAGLKRIAELARQTKLEQEAAYQGGRLLVSEYNQAAAACNQAQQEVWQAEYDLIALLLE